MIGRVCAAAVLIVTVAGGLWLHSTSSLSSVIAADVPTIGGRSREGYVVTVEDLPLDQAGRPVLDGLPGVIPQRAVPQSLEAAQAPLREERDRILRSGRSARVALPAVNDPSALPRMDAGVRDPDRLRPESQPPLPNF